MKKITVGAAFLIAAFAQGVLADNAIQPLANGDQVILSDCSLLADDVTVSVSNGVLAGMFCRTGAGVVSDIVVATCHTAGRTASRTVETPCTRVTPLPPGQVACDNTGPGGATSSVNVATAQGAAIMVGQTSGGSIGPKPLNGTVCSATGTPLNQYLQ